MIKFLKWIANTFTITYKQMAFIVIALAVSVCYLAWLIGEIKALKQQNEGLKITLSLTKEEYKILYHIAENPPCDNDSQCPGWACPDMLGGVRA